MATAIEDGKIGGGNLVGAERIPNAAGTGVWEDIAAPNATTLTSGEFRLAQTLGGAEVRLVAGTDGLVTGGSNVVSVVVTTASASGGSFGTVHTLSLPTSTTYAAGDVIMAFNPGSDETNTYAKIAVTVATDDLSAYDLTAYVIAVGD